MSGRLRIAALLGAVFVTSCAAAMAGAWLACGAPIEKWGDVATWVAGLGTLLAVGVALLPIGIEWNRRRAVGDLLRRRLTLRFAVLRTCFSFVLQRHQADVVAGENRTVELPEDPREDIASIERLFADTHLLEPEEVHVIDQAIIAMRANLRHGDEEPLMWSLQGVEESHDAADRAYSVLLRGLQRRRGFRGS
jgi:hypothetical protein